MTLYTTHGEPFTVDDEDTPLVKQFEWRMLDSGSIHGRKACALATSKLFSNEKRRALRLRALIMGHPPLPGLYALCINGNQFCMEKTNLAWADASTMRHWTTEVKNPNGYRGVIYASQFGQWRISCLYHQYQGYLTPVEAAHAYDRAVRERYGSWARVNFPRSDDPLPTGLHFPPPKGPLQAMDGTLLQVDPEYLAVLSRHNWHPGPHGYWTNIGRLQLGLANLLLRNPGPGGRLKPRWLDGDIRNCTRSNLRWFSMGNSPYLGVVKLRTRWLAMICHQRRDIPLGLFSTAEEAAHARDRVAKEFRGDRAHLNFPEDSRMEEPW